MAPPKLLAFDLDGTLLTNDKRLSSANRAALHDMVACGSVVTLASGRMASSMQNIADQLDVDVAMLTLNGAAVYQSALPQAQPVYSARLGVEYSDALIRFATEENLPLNYYSDGKLFAVRNRQTAPWLDLYIGQTRSPYEYVESLEQFYGKPPFKVLLLETEAELDAHEAAFRSKWDNELYIVRTWEFYLEFLDTNATKAKGLAALAASLNIDMADVAAFGDGNNDIPMLEVAGVPIAMKNGTADAKAAAGYVSPWTNEEDAVAREWERLKKS